MVGMNQARLAHVKIALVAVDFDEVFLYSTDTSVFFNDNITD